MAEAKVTRRRAFDAAGAQPGSRKAAAVRAAPAATARHIARGPGIDDGPPADSAAGRAAGTQRIVGIDFTSRPRVGARGKAIVVAHAVLDDAALAIARLQPITDFAAFEALLATPGPWLGGFDFPFGLPRRFVDAQRPGADWPTLMRWIAAQSREQFCALTFAAFSAARGNPAAKHRAVDAAFGSHSPLKTMDPVRRIAINPPVGLMLYEGAPRLLAAGLHLPGHHATGDARVALEVYPGAVALRLGVRHYKNDKPHNATVLRAARRRLIAALRAGQAGVPVTLPPRLARQAIDDASGDSLDAMLCAVAAACAARKGPDYGLPPFDPVEGWISG
jgi:hypothetical protein